MYYTYFKEASKALSTLIRFQKYAFTLTLMRFRPRNDSIALCELYAPATNTHTRDFSGHRFHFDAFSTVQTKGGFPLPHNFHVRTLVNKKEAMKGREKRLSCARFNFYIYARPIIHYLYFICIRLPIT